MVEFSVMMYFFVFFLLMIVFLFIVFVYYMVVVDVILFFFRIEEIWEERKEIVEVKLKDVEWFIYKLVVLVKGLYEVLKW